MAFPIVVIFASSGSSSSSGSGPKWDDDDRDNEYDFWDDVKEKIEDAASGDIAILLAKT